MSDVEGFNERDRERAIHLETGLSEMSDRIALLERGQRVGLRRIRKLPDLTAAAIVRAISKRALILIGIGIAIGSALGGAGIELAKALVASALGH